MMPEKIRDPEDFRALLKKEFTRRLEKNPAYSLRAFARNLGINDSTLSQILRGKRVLSQKSIFKMGAALNLGPNDLERFYRANDKSTPAPKTLEWDTYQLTAEWYYDAILVLVDFPDFQMSGRWVGIRLGISAVEANEALDRLKRMGMIGKNSRGEWQNTIGSTETAYDPDLNSAAQVRYQKEIAALSQKALDEIPKKFRSSTSMIVGVDESELEEFKLEIRKLQRKFLKKVQMTNRRPQRVYAMQMAFFPLDTMKKNRVKK